MDLLVSQDISCYSSDTPLIHSMMVQAKSAGQELLAGLNDFRDRCLFTDAVLCAGQDEFPCHRAVLAATSPYFKAAFSGQFCEQAASRVQLGAIISADTLQRMIQWVYTGKLELNDDCALEVLSAAHLLQYESLVHDCAHFVQSHIAVSNCLGIEQFADMHQLLELKDAAHQFAVDNFSAVTLTEEFVQLPHSTLLRYLNVNNIDVSTEEEVFTACLRWVHHCPIERQEILPQLLKSVRLQHLTDRFVQNCALLDPLVRASPQALTLLSSSSSNESYTNKSSTSSEPSLDDIEAIEEVDTNNRRPSTLRQECLVILGSNLGFIEVLYFKKQKWSTLSSLHLGLKWYGAAVFYNDIWLTGGILFDDGNVEKVVDQVWRYDSSLSSWNQEESLLTPRARHAVAVTGNHLLIVGGISTISGTLIERIDCWNSHTRQWSTVGRTPEPMVRAESSLACWGGLLLEAGGIRQPGDFVSSTMDTYITILDNEEHKLEMQYTGEHFVLPHSLRRACFVVHGDVFFLLWEEARLFYQLDPIKRSLRQLDSPKFARRFSSMTAVQGKLYIAGGELLSQVSSEYNNFNFNYIPVECYDPVFGKWTVFEGPRCHFKQNCCLFAITL